MKRIGLLFLLLFLLKNAAFSQSQSLFQRNERRMFTVRLGGDKSGQTDQSRVVRMLADADGRAASTFQYDIEWNQSLRVLRESPRMIILQVDHSDIKVTQQVRVRGFDVNRFLNPSYVEFSYAFRPSPAVAPYNYDNISKRINNGRAERAENRITDSTTTTAATLGVTSVWMVYNEATIRQLDERIRLIKDYYGSEILLNQAYDRLMRINPQDVLMLDMQNAELLQVEKVISDTKARNFESELELMTYDPIDMRNKLNRLEEEAAARRVAMNQTKANLFLFFYNSGLDLKARGRYQQAYEAFMRSIHENPLFAPALYQLALMDFEEGRYIESECRTRTILMDMVPDPDIERMARTHMIRLNDTYTELGEERLKQGNIDEALDLFKRAANLCRTTRNIPCNERLENDLLRAHQAKYKQLLDQARAAYNANDLDLTERRIEQAVYYQQINYRYLTSNSEANDMRRVVKQKRYDILLTDAQQLVTQGNNNAAINKLMQARELEVKEGVARSNSYAQLVRTAGKPLFMAKAEAARQSARDNRLSQARNQVQELYTLSDNYLLQDDRDAAAALNEVKNMIFSQECANAQQQLDGLAVKAGEAYDRHEYIKADNLIRQALKVSDDNADCRLNEGNLRSSLDSLRPAVTYQKMIADAVQLQSNGRHAEAHAEYTKAGNFYEEQHIVRYSLRHAEIDDFAYAQCNDEFIVYLSVTYIDKKDYDHSLSMFKKILTRNGGSVSSSMNKALVRLGTELAVRDKATGAATSYKTGVLRYTNGDKRLKSLEKGYRQGWKKG